MFGLGERLRERLGEADRRYELMHTQLQRELATVSTSLDRLSEHVGRVEQKLSEVPSTAEHDLLAERIGSVELRLGSRLDQLQGRAAGISSTVAFAIGGSGVLTAIISVVINVIVNNR